MTTTYHSTLWNILLLAPRHPRQAWSKLQLCIHASQPSTHCHQDPPTTPLGPSRWTNIPGHGQCRRAWNTRGERRIHKEAFKIVIIQQSACSIEVNALYLGIWMSIQSRVKNKHQNQCRDPDSLAATVREVWENLPEVTIQRVFNWIPFVLQQIVEHGGDNINVEERRGRCNMAVAAPEWLFFSARQKIWEKYTIEIMSGQNSVRTTSLSDRLSLITHTSCVWRPSAVRIGSTKN